MTRRTCDVRDRKTGRTCTLLDDHTNGRDMTDDGIIWPDRLVIVRRVRRALYTRALRRAAARGGAR